MTEIADIVSEFMSENILSKCLVLNMVITFMSDMSLVYIKYLRVRDKEGSKGINIIT